MQPRVATVVPTQPTLAGAAAWTLETQLGRLTDAAGCLEWSADPGRVKRARISGRRLRAGLQLFGPSLQPKQARQLVRELEVITSALGAVRDWDVVLAALAVAPSNGELAPVLHVVAMQRERANRGLERRLTPHRVRQLSSRVGRYINSVARNDRSPRLRHVAGRLLWQRYEEVQVRTDWRDRPELAAAHSARRALRRFRYALEGLGPWLQAGKAVLGPVKAGQEVLGRLNDADMLVHHLEPLAGRASLPVAEAGCVKTPLLAYLDGYRDERDRLLATVPPALQPLLDEPFRSALAALIASL
ncbi:MAG: CHAD domain-containing protein [Chloroflexota bacterium]